MLRSQPLAVPHCQNSSSDRRHSSRSSSEANMTGQTHNEGQFNACTVHRSSSRRALQLQKPLYARPPERLSCAFCSFASTDSGTGALPPTAATKNNLRACQDGGGTARPVLANLVSATSFHRSCSPVSRVSCKAAPLLIFLPHQDRVTENKEERVSASFFKLSERRRRYTRCETAELVN